MKRVVTVDRLQPGVYVSLGGLSWLDHPFLLNRFRITDEEQIKVLRSLGLKEIEWDPERSSAFPLPEAVKAPEQDLSASVLEPMLELKRQRREQVRVQREGMARCERLFEQETTALSEIFADLGGRPAEAYGRAKGAVGRMVGGLLEADSVAVHLVNLKAKDSGLAHHAMNVAVISLLIGKACGCSEEELRSLGLGAMFHDVGKVDVPSRVLRNPQRPPAEEQFYRAHVGYSIKHISAIKDMPVAVRNIIACHHEHWDGSGFPNRLEGEKIPRLARIVAIANRYDNLCNPFDLQAAMTPAEAMSLMFKKEGARFDPAILSVFVKALGVYPPGSFVVLTDGMIGLVVETNDRDLLHPVIMLYDPTVPRSEALLVDLHEAGVKIQQAVSPKKLPKELVEYLAPRGRVDYYIDGTR